MTERQQCEVVGFVFFTAACCANTPKLQGMLFLWALASWCAAVVFAHTDGNRRKGA